jgi:hypothetical protein
MCAEGTFLALSRLTALGAKGRSFAMFSTLSTDSERLWITRSHIIKAQEYVLVQKAQVDELEVEGAPTRDAKLKLAMLKEILRILEGEYVLLENRVKARNRTTRYVPRAVITQTDPRSSPAQRFTA